MFIFQYLIGSTDWSIVAAEADEYCCHNVDLFEIDASLLVVPYDFTAHHGQTGRDLGAARSYTGPVT